MANIELSPGIIVDTEADRAYLMAPEGGVTAISVTDGAEIWTSDAADKPLVVLGDLLVGQSAPGGTLEGVTVRTLKVNEGGSVEQENAVPIPPGVSPTLEPSAHVGFDLSGEAQGDDAVLRWVYRERPLRGLATGDDEVLPGEALPAAAGGVPGAVLETAPEPTSDREETVIRGQVRLILGDEGGIQPLVEPNTELELPSVPQFPGSRPDAAPRSTLESASATFDPHTFFSADRMHRLVSNQVEDSGGIWPVYHWTIYPIDSDTPLGSVDLHLSYAPFIVTAGRLIVELQPYSRLSGDTMQEEPMQIRAYDVANGNEVWKTVVRDIYAVPEPPH